MKKIILILFLSILSFADNIKNAEYLDKSSILKNIDKIRVGTFGEHPNTFFVNIYMLNKSNKKIMFQVVQEYDLPLTQCTFNYDKNLENKSSFNWTGNCNELLSDKGQILFLINLEKSLEKKILYMYYEGEIN